MSYTVATICLRHLPFDGGRFSRYAGQESAETSITSSRSPFTDAKRTDPGRHRPPEHLLLPPRRPEPGSTDPGGVSAPPGVPHLYGIRTTDQSHSISRPTSPGRERGSTYERLPAPSERRWTFHDSPCVVERTRGRRSSALVARLARSRARRLSRGLDRQLRARGGLAARMGPVPSRVKYDFAVR